MRLKTLEYMNYNLSTSRRLTLGLIVLTLSFFVTKTYGQSGGLEGGGETGNEMRPSDINVIPPSPNVAAFNKYIDIPVSLYTGSVQASVPIFELKLNQISVPISLSYHASGLKVEEIPSFVGAGWVLNGMGVISRVSKGLPDEMTMSGGKKGYFHNSHYYQSNDLPHLPSINCTVGDSYNSDYPDNLRSGKPYTSADSVSQGFIDLEPDLFHYSFPGGGGKFAFTARRDLKKLTTDDVNVIVHPFQTEIPDYFNSPDYTWILEDASGVRYEYKNSEKTEITSMCDDLLSPYNPSIQRFQSSWYLDKITIGGEWVRFYYDNEVLIYDTRISYSKKYRIDGTAGSSSEISPCTQSTKVYAKRLNRIESSNGFTIKFEANTNRLDLDGSKRLDEIVIEKDGEQVYKYRLSYDYFGNNVKLKLLSVNQVSNSNNDLLLDGYSFEYYEGIIPARDSKNQDLWGYYNGALNTQMFPSYRDDYYYYPFPAVNRDPNLDNAKIGSIKRIHYPTKGFTEFEYELHDYFNGSYRDQFPPIIRHASGGSMGNQVIALTPNFTVPQSCSADIKKENLANTDYLYKFNGSTYEPYTPQNTIGNRVILEAGEYYGKVINNNADHISKLEISYDKFITKNVKVGGLRIKKITFYDANKDKKLIKGYLYTSDFALQYESGEYFYPSSGVLFTTQLTPMYFTKYISGYLVSLTCSPTGYATYINFSDQTLVPMSTYHGSHIGYSEVKEFYMEGEDADVTLVEAQKGGLTVHKFINEATPTLQSYPYVPQEDISFKNGKVKSVTTYIYNSYFRKVKEINYGYSQKDIHAKVWGINFKRLTNKFCYDCDLNADGEFAMNLYRYNLVWHYPVKVTELDFNVDAFPTRKRITRHYHDTVSYSHFFPTRTLTEYQTEDNIIEEYSRINGRPALVHETIAMRNNLRIGGNKIDYQDKMPINYYSWDTESNTYRQLVNNQILENGNISRSTAYPDQGGGTNRSFCWGYNNAFPIAEAINSLSDRIAYTSFENETSKGGWEFNSANTETNAGRTGFRALSEGSVIKSNLPNDDYKLSFWAKKSGISHGSIVISGIGTESFTNNDWQYFEYTLNSASSVSLNLTNTLIDELRLHPLGSTMTTYTYYPHGISSVTDANNSTTYYEYDDFNRLKLIKDHEGNILKTYEYNYQLR